ncbi:MAG TPA: M43 family zinc metalloprotease [candidate division Zixibacteria bacterium]
MLALVDEVFRGRTTAPDPMCPHSSRSDVDCDCAIDVFDMVAMIDVAFRAIDPADRFCNPCALTPLAPVAGGAHAITASRKATESLDWCGTDHTIPLTKGAGCPLQGPCDDPMTRDGTLFVDMLVNVIVHVVGSDNCWGFLPQETVDATIDKMNQDFAVNGSAIQFNLVATRFHDDIQFASVASLSELASLKAVYAESPQTQCNIYISDASPGFHISGIATFPWRDEALTNQGGFWLNRLVAGGESRIASHEMGHCLGLWHTHQYVYSSGSCADCIGLASGFEGDLRGDFAADTPPTPVNYACLPPEGADCEGTPWGPTQPENYMGYGPDSCSTLFTPNQVSRMQCWTQDVLTGWW